MKKLVLLSIFLALPLMLGAQSTSSTASVAQPAAGPANIAGLLYASNFAHWTLGPTPQGNSWTSPGQCYGTSGGVVFPLFSKTAPITIVDLGVPSNTETVTPTIVSYSVSGCSVGLPATHPHSNYYLQSGTLGLQEAINFAGAGNYVVIITPDWKAMGGTTGMITSAKGTAAIGILDERSSVIPYVWGGSAYAASPFAGGSTYLPLTGGTLTGGLIGTTLVLSSTATASGSVLTAAAPTAASGQIGFGSTTAVVANCGTTGPTACIVVNIAGTTHYIPYY